MTPPQLGDQILWAQSMPLKTAAHRQPSQGDGSSQDLIERAFKFLEAPGCGVNLKRIGFQLCKQVGEVVEPNPMIRGFNQAKGTGRQTASTAIAAAWVDTGTSVNGISRTDPLAGAGTIGGAAGGIKDSLAKMGIATVTDADHQPGRVTCAIASPAEAGASCVDNSGVGCHINTLHSCNRIQSAEIGHRSQILITGPADQLDPTALPEGIVTGLQRTGDRQKTGLQAPSSRVIGCQRRLRAPPISTTTFRRGSRRQRSQRESNSDREST